MSNCPYCNNVGQNKEHDKNPGNMPQLYDEKKYAEIESYIKKEADEFSKFCVRLYEEMPRLLWMSDPDPRSKIYTQKELFLSNLLIWYGE